MEAKSAYGPPSAPERRECKSWVSLLLRDADSGQIDHMAAEPTHGPHHPCSSSSWLGARGPFLGIANLLLPGGSMFLSFYVLAAFLPSLTGTSRYTHPGIKSKPGCIPVLVPEMED